MADTFATNGTITAVALDATFTSQWWAPGDRTPVSFHLFLDNTDSVGTIKIQGSNNPTDDTLSGLDQSFVENGSEVTSISVTSGNDVNEGVLIPYAGFAAYRVVFTRTSGGASNLLSCWTKAILVNGS